MRVRLLTVAICLILLLGMGLLGVMLLKHQAGRDTTPDPVPVKGLQEDSGPAYGLPLEITIEDLPEVPKEVQGPSPPIEEQGE